MRTRNYPTRVWIVEMRLFLICVVVVLSGAVSRAEAQVLATERDALETNGVRIAYRDLGTGEPLLLLHGFAETGSTWDPILEELSAGNRLIIPELRGHGASTNPDGVFTHRAAAVDMFGLLDGLGVDRFRAVGFSSGGMTLLHMATSQPSRITGMVLIGTPPYLPSEARGILEAMASESMSEADLEALGELHGGGVAQARELMRQFHGFAGSYTDVNFSPPLLSTIQAPTLIVHGDRDPFFPIELPVDLYQSIPNSYVLILPNAGHVPFPEAGEGREYFTMIVRAFLSGAWFED